MPMGLNQKQKKLVWNLINHIVWTPIVMVMHGYPENYKKFDTLPKTPMNRIKYNLVRSVIALTWMHLQKMVKNFSRYWGASNIKLNVVE